MDKLLTWLNFAILRFSGVGTILETFDINNNVFKLRIIRRIISYGKSHIPIRHYISIKDPIINDFDSFIKLIHKLESIPHLKLLIENVTHIEAQNYFISNGYKSLIPEFDNNELIFTK